MTDDIRLWERLVDGQREAFDLLFRKYSMPIRGFIRHYLESADAADDVVQETFLQLWKRPNGFDPARGTLKQYLFGIARKRVAQWLRESSSQETELKTEPVAPGVDGLKDFKELLMHLDAEQRGLLWLREVEGHSYSELAEILGVPIGTVKSRLFSARESLRCLWQDGRKAE